MNAEPSQQHHKRHEKETHSERQTSQNEGEDRERKRERGVKGGEWESRESFRHRAATAFAASWLRNKIRNRRCPSLLFFIPILCSSFQQCLISGTAFSSLATGLSVTRLVPQASCRMPCAMCLACHVPQPSHTLLQAVCLIWFWLLYFAAALFFFRFPLFFCRIVSLCN